MHTFCHATLRWNQYLWNKQSQVLVFMCICSGLQFRKIRLETLKLLEPMCTPKFPFYVLRKMHLCPCKYLFNISLRYFVKSAKPSTFFTNSPPTPKTPNTPNLCCKQIIFFDFLGVLLIFSAIFSWSGQINPLPTEIGLND